MLVCAAGMSTSMLVTRDAKAAEKDGLSVHFLLQLLSDADNKLESENQMS